jgi:hypothetical protein
MEESHLALPVTKNDRLMKISSETHSLGEREQLEHPLTNPRGASRDSGTPQMTDPT